MDFKTAVLAFALSAAADEAGTRYALAHGAVETGGMMGPQSTRTRLIVKGSIAPLYVYSQGRRRPKLVRVLGNVVPLAFVIGGVRGLREGNKGNKEGRK